MTDNAVKDSLIVFSKGEYFHLCRSAPSNPTIDGVLRRMDSVFVCQPKAGDLYLKDGGLKGGNVLPHPIIDFNKHLPQRIDYLRYSAEFRLVYEQSQRCDGAFMTVFILKNCLNKHRFGITASRKMAKKAILRNRAKRLLRETCRLSCLELDQLIHKYDWVLNAKRSLLVSSVVAPLEEFRMIISWLSELEGNDSIETVI